MSEVTTWYLEMMSPAALCAVRDPGGLQVSECRVAQYQFNRFLYQLVGAAWDWTDKLAWSDRQWQAYAEDDRLRTWVAYTQGSPAGYFELQQQTGGDTEIKYFGLVERFIGRGFGGFLLSQALEAAWAWPGTERVWVHTCSLDHPGALHNYQARGMTLYRTETETALDCGGPNVQRDGEEI